MWGRVDLLQRSEPFAMNYLAHPVEAHTRPISPAIEFPPLAHHTIGDALLHVSVHNSHHLGQVIVLRQLMGCWPPPAGRHTW
jgi:uncharacterized damage-inducible protein DinB